ncbi:hypothetical protein HBO38_35960 [Pseudomonas veronii]|uniref:Uncharacterized protein n=1 Tax=Pseudomonas veronii TaxID=76761 RepID=A0A7Y1ADJ9_PSEVE|nr:hypothetical protein [Pseudomonas veronii]NMY13705.1 hypothetical protein [Pseudomonas veronii]
MVAVADPRILNQSMTRQAIDQNNFAQVIFSYAQTASGNWSVLSRFTDDTWIIPDSYFPTNVTSSHKRLEFGRYPEQFRHVMKVCVLKYALFGLYDQGAPRGNTIIHFFVGTISFLTYISKHSVDLQSIKPILFSNYVFDSKTVKGALRI